MLDALLLRGSMFELLIGSFLLGSLSLAFRDHRDQSASDTWHSELEPHSNLPEDFDISVYEPLPIVEPEYLQKRYGTPIPNSMLHPDQQEQHGK